MELAAITLWRQLPDSIEDDPISLKAFEMNLDSWLAKALPCEQSEEFCWVATQVLNILYQIRKWKEENESYRYCNIILVKETKLFEKIND